MQTVIDQPKTDPDCIPVHVMVMRQFDPFFDQEEPECSIQGMVASVDVSEPYELDAAAVFRAGRNYLVVIVGGCSCWPDLGATTQQICKTKSEVDRMLTGRYRSLLQKCQDAKWKVTEPVAA